MHPLLLLSSTHRVIAGLDHFPGKGNKELKVDGGLSGAQP